ncbi:hypothetical protein [Mucilaginibacter sp. UR6-11]|uniref:hypothetical protein n=1 Tax=Mucilaginibacter sp. UR6-11 TaxID=1435644 RepID=UPI001E2ED6D9|nr:hypothetical protein [Mucilaginibacter sp. UR6-11]MCC8427291.1 hypothetical protein [Mucilaginibacter sp. UR6-11]
MKKILLTAVLLVSCLMFKADAQLRISLGLNIGSQPDWGPVGYDHASYYYMPDVDAYYDVPNHQYVYFENNRWVRGAGLPGRYNFDPYNSYKVVVNERNPWERASVYRTKYKVYKGRRDQQIIRNSRDTKYRNHWQDHNDYGRGPGNSDNGHDRGNHGNGNQGNGYGNQGNGRGNDHGNGHGDDHGNGRGNDHGNGGGNDQGHGNGHGRGHGDN